MSNNEIRRLLQLPGPLPVEYDVQQLDEFLQNSLTVTAEADRQKLFAWLTQPTLRLVWAQPPEAGQHCVQDVELRLPATLRGWQPNLEVKFPDSLAGNGGQGSDFRPLSLDYQLDPESLWRTNLEFRMGVDFSGVFLWQFRIDFRDCWGDARLHRWFQCQYTAKIDRDATGATTLEITAADFSNVQVPPGKWDHVKITAGGNANILKTTEYPDYRSMLAGSNQNVARQPDGVVIEPGIRRWDPHRQGHQRVLPYVVTPRIPPLNESGSIRSSWPDVLTASLQITPGDPSARPVNLRLHTVRELKIGRSNEDFNNDNDIVTDFDPLDFPTLTADQLNLRQFTISSANSVLGIGQGRLIIRNTGTPGSEYAGRTQVSCSSQNALIQERQLIKRDEEYAIDVRSKQVTFIDLYCGGGYMKHEPGRPFFNGYHLQIKPVLFWDDNDTNGWYLPENFESLIGSNPGLSKKAGNHGLDALLISHQVLTKDKKPIEVMLLRQLWLRSDGQPIEDLTNDKPGRSAVARLLIGQPTNGGSRVILVQSLRGEGLYVRRPLAASAEMKARPGDLVPLHDGDQLTLKSANRVLWTAAFHVLRSGHS